MKMKTIRARLFAGALALAVSSLIAGYRPVQALTLKSVPVTLPDRDRDLPDGPGLAAVQNNCTTCHSPGMILTQPAMPKAAWAAEVAKMRKVFKAPVNDNDVPAIVGYLTAVKGSK